MDPPRPHGAGNPPRSALGPGKMLGQDAGKMLLRNVEMHWTMLLQNGP